MQMRTNRSLSRKHLCSNQGTKNSSKSAWRTFSYVKLEILRCRDAELWLNLDEARTTNRKHMTTELTAAVAQRPAGSKTNRCCKKRGTNRPKMVLWLVIVLQVRLEHYKMFISVHLIHFILFISSLFLFRFGLKHV